MHLISWNVNGIRAALKKGLVDYLNASNADVVCLQEVRAKREQAPQIEELGYHIFWNDAQKAGYSGTAIFTKQAPLNAWNDIGNAEHDAEGRVITLEYDAFYLVCVYTPNAKRDLSRLEYRTQEWEPAFCQYVSALDQKKPVVFCGDLNVAHQEIDLARPKGNHKSAGFTDEERQCFTNLLSAGFVDSYRCFSLEGGHYTWWSNMNQARARNIGWRIDYFCVSQRWKDQMKETSIQPDVMGSDHCPVSLTLQKNL